MTAPTLPALHVQGLEKSFKELHVLRGVDFDVAKGSIFALLGSNGAGKTTVVRILSTLLKPDAGTVTVVGHDVVTHPAEVRESISLTGQFAAVDEILTGRENLVLVARLRHLKDAGRVADGLLERFELADAAQRRVATYSGGMRRRLDIAMSLIGNPPVIFLDEPTTGLDPQGRIEVWNSVKELAGKGTTVLLTTQYLDEAEQLADQIAILHEGRIIVNGFDVATQAAEVRESISLTGQFAAVDDVLTGRENLILIARLRHLADPGTIADDLLRRFALTDAASRPVSTYSGGMRRRLDIAMSLIGNPPVIFLDEPTAGLDPQARIDVWQAVKELAGHGTTVLLTTQYLDEAEQLADRIAILHEGRIIVNGTLAELKALIPPARVEYIEKQATLEDLFLAIVGDKAK